MAGRIDRDDVTLADPEVAEPACCAQRSIAKRLVADGHTVGGDVGSTIAEALGGLV